jgi:Cft2 family RNA processing exonuclease
MLYWPRSSRGDGRGAHRIPADWIQSERVVEVVFDRGVYLPELDLWMDSRRKRDLSVISHAHSDHIGRHQRPALTPNTLLLLADYLKGADPISLPYRQPLQCDGYTITLYPAGHCLGSAQVLVRSEATGERVLYTGDIKTEASPTNEPLEPVPCDTLILESTYGKPSYVFPPQERTLDSAFRVIESWLERGQRPVIQVWRLGKAQEIFHHLLARGFEVMLEDSVAGITQRYLEAGVSFPGGFVPFHGAWAEGKVLVCPPVRGDKLGLGEIRGKRYMELTGWAAADGRGWSRRADASLPFSDHPDFNQLVAYVKQVAPKRVYTVNGFPDLAGHLRGMGYPAVHLDGKARSNAGFQMDLL